MLAYSGGLDTSIIIPWLKEHYNNCEVIAVCGNIGQTGELDDLEQRAKASGASKLYVEDLTDEFVDEYVIPTMQAGADYEGYLLGTSFARPVLAKRVVEIAKAEGADSVCHGSTGKGNDQVRFELAIMHFDVVENRLVGMKSRGVYETPGGTILYRAHEVLETLALDKQTAHKKRELAITFGELVYDGQWFSPLCKALSAFVTETQQTVTGKVRLKLYKGNIINAGVWSPYSLYSEEIATFDAGGSYQQSDATGFIKLYGLPTRVQAAVAQKNGEEKEC